MIFFFRLEAKSCLFESYLCCVSDRLPGPPQNVHVELIDAHSVRVRWDPPVKNPNTVELYR
jgi:hypothetical protein